MGLPATPLHGNAPRSQVEARFEVFARQRWAALGVPDGDDLSPSDVELLAATGEPVSLDEVAEVYRPLGQLLALRADAAVELRHRTDAFLDVEGTTAPFIIGIAGSVAVGKSTTARILQALLGRGPGRPHVELLTTDGFLYPNAVLETRGLMSRKGFPESYDQRKLIDALAAIKGGQPEVETPVYSHRTYDVVSGESQVIRHPDIVIVEGLNVLQVNTKEVSPDHVVVSDFFDVSIYVDAAEEDMARWFRERLLGLRTTARQDPRSFFYAFASMTDEQVLELAEQIWTEINLVNLHENIAPTRGRAHVVLDKAADHRVSHVRLRRA